MFKVGGKMNRYCLVGIGVMLFGVGYWAGWRILLPKVFGYELVPHKEVLEDGTSVILVRTLRNEQGKRKGSDRVIPVFTQENSMNIFLQKDTHYWDLAPHLFWLFECILVGCMYELATRCLTITLLLFCMGCMDAVFSRARLSSWSGKERHCGVADS